MVENHRGGLLTCDDRETRDCRPNLGISKPHKLSSQSPVVKSKFINLWLVPEMP